jgi:hypothetical protein
MPSSVIQFFHFLVKEFLTLARLAGHATLYPTVIMFPGHLHIPCSTTLFGHSALHLDKDVVTSKSLERSPLAEYAAEYWVTMPSRMMCHKMWSGKYVGGMKQLFNSNKPHLLVCIWICDPNVLLESLETKSPS